MYYDFKSFFKLRKVYSDGALAFCRVSRTRQKKRKTAKRLMACQHMGVSHRQGPTHTSTHSLTHSNGRSPSGGHI